MRLFSRPPVLQALALEKGLQEGAIWMIPSKCGVLLSMQLVKEDAAEEEIKAFHNTVSQGGMIGRPPPSLLVEYFNTP